MSGVTGTSHDAEMNSSPTSSFDAEDEVDLFPESTTETTANTAQLAQHEHLNASAPGELSPPRSQGSEEPEAPLEANPSTNGHPMTDYREDRMAGTNGEAQAPTKPGSGWNTKRAQEEFQRAWDGLLDKDFSLKEFGDVMAISDDQQDRR